VRCDNDHHDIWQIAIELMQSESVIPMTSMAEAKRFAGRLAAFYATMFGMLGTYLPFFPVWLKAIGIESSWIGIIIAVPAVTRFTVFRWSRGWPSGAGRCGRRSSSRRSPPRSGWRWSAPSSRRCRYS
jgi:MFS_1 like family